VPIGLLTGPAPAQAAPCSQWGFNGETELRQANEWDVSFTSTGAAASGSALARAQSTGDYLTGNITGGINGRTVDLTIKWSNAHTGRYRGNVADDGFAHGTTIDETEPASTSRWDSRSPLACIAASAPPAPPAPPHAPAASTSVQIKSGPATLPAGLSGTYVVTVNNTFTEAQPVRVFIIFAGKLEQTGQINAQGGLNCVIGNDAGINAAVTCTGPIPQGTLDIVVQGRGSAPGAGQLLAKLDNDTKQQNVTIT
jgi:hypothetical protein